MDGVVLGMSKCFKSITGIIFLFIVFCINLNFVNGFMHGYKTNDMLNMVISLSVTAAVFKAIHKANVFFVIIVIAIILISRNSSFIAMLHNITRFLPIA
jgi:hypothetical protein